MKKILLNGVDGNFGSRSAKILIEKYPHEDLIFTAPSRAALEPYAALGIETRIVNYNVPDKLADAFTGADTVIMISMPFVGPRRRAAHKTAIDAFTAAHVNKVVYTSIVGAGDPTIDTYEVNDHIWTEAYLKEQPLHWLIMRDSQYAEAMVGAYLESVANTDSILSNNMGDGHMAFISRDDCAVAAAYAAMSDREDEIINVNGAELLTMTEFCSIANSVTGHHVQYKYITDEENYAYFDSIGVPRTTEEMWADTAGNFPFCSDGMITFGRAIRQEQMSVFTNEFEELTGRKPLTVREVFEDINNHQIGNRVSTDD